MAGNETKEDIVQLVVAAYDAAPGAVLMRELEAVIDERGGSLLDVAAALISGERWGDLYPASWTADRFADEWLGSLLPGATPALMAAAREIVVGHLDAGGGFAELVLAAQEYLSGPDVPARFAGAARSFLDRSEAAMALSVDLERAGPATGPQTALALMPGGAGTERTAVGAPSGGGATGDYDGDGAVDDSKEEAFDAAGRPVRIEYDFDSDGTVNHVETHTRIGGITTQLIEVDDGGGAGAVAGDGVFDYRERRTTLDGVTVRILIDADNDGAWDESAGLSGFDGRLTYIFGVGGWLESVGQDGDNDGTYDWISTYAFTRHENGGIKTKLTEVDGKTAGGPADGAVDEVWLETYAVDGMSESIKFDHDGDGAYDVVSVMGDYDDDGAVDDDRTETFDAAGRPVRTEYDFDSDGTVNRIETNARDGDITTRLIEIDYGKDGDAGGKGAGDGVFDYRVQGTIAGNVVIRFLFDADNDGTWDEPARPTVFDKPVFGDFSIWRTLAYTYGADGWLESIKADDNLDGVYDRIVTHAYGFHGDGGLKTWLSEEDDGWSGGAAGRMRDGVGVHREDGGLITGPIYGYGPSGGMISGKRRLFTYGADGVQESIKHDDDGDGAYDRISATTRTHHENGAIKTILTERDGGQGDGPADGVVDGREIETYDADGMEESSMGDIDNDGTYDWTYMYTHHANGELKTKLTELDNGWHGGVADDGIADFRRLATYDADGALESSKWDLDGDGAYEDVRTYHENGQIKTKLVEFYDGSGGGAVVGRRLFTYGDDGVRESSKFDDDGDGTYDRINTPTQTYHEDGRRSGPVSGTYGEVRTYHENGKRKTHLIQYDDGRSGGIADDGTIDGRQLLAYDIDGRLVSRSFDDDNNGEYDRIATYTHHENGRGKTTLLEHDDGSGGGTADDGIVDRRRLVTNDVDGAHESDKYDNDGDGTWDIVDVFDWTRTFGGRPLEATRTYTMGTEATDDDEARVIRFIYGIDAPETGTAGSGADWYELGGGGDTITGGGGKDVFVFRGGYGTNVIMDFEPRIDTILIRSNGFDPADVELESLALRAGEEAMHPHIPARLFPADASTVDVAVLTYGGGPDDRIIIVGGNGSEDFYRAHFLLHAGHEPDLSGLGG